MGEGNLTRFILRNKRNSLKYHSYAFNFRKFFIKGFYLTDVFSHNINRNRIISAFAATLFTRCIITFYVTLSHSDYIIH